MPDKYDKAVETALGLEFVESFNFWTIGIILTQLKCDMQIFNTARQVV